MALRLIDGSEFLHIPKTAGSWVTRVLEDNGLVAKRVSRKHATYDLNLFGERTGSDKQLLRYGLRVGAARVKSLLRIPGEGPDSPARFRFCFVRHPLSWYESWWRYMQGQNWNHWGRQNSSRYWDPDSLLNGLGSDDFNTFVANVVRARPGYVSELFYAYTKPGISFIGKTETLCEDMLTVLNHLGFSVDSTALTRAGKENASARSPDDLVWDNDLKRLVMQLELPALVHFDYLDYAERRTFGVPDSIVPHQALRTLRAPAGTKQK